MEQSSYNWYREAFKNTVQPFEERLNLTTGDKRLVITNYGGQKVTFLFNNLGGYITFKIGEVE